MLNWNEYKVGDILRLEYGKSLLDYRSGIGEFDVFGTNGKIGKTEKYIYDKPSIIIGRKGAYRETHFAAKPFFVIDTAFYTKKIIDDLDILFLYYWFKNVDINLMDSGSAIPSTSRDEVYDLDILLPNFHEQKSIAGVLSSLDDKIDLLHRQNATLEAMAETLFRQWFVEEAKEEWEVVKIKDFDVIVTDYVANGSFASLAENVNYKAEPDFAKLIRLTDFNNNFSGDFVYVDEQAYNFLKKSKLFGGEIIISNVGAYAGTVFKCPKLDTPMTLGPNAIVLKSKFDNYFYLLFKSTYGKFILDGIISGSAQPKFNKTTFREVALSYPSIDYITDFENIVEVYFHKIDANKKQIRTLTTLRDTLLPKLMSGEVKVKN